MSPTILPRRQAADIGSGPVMTRPYQRSYDTRVARWRARRRFARLWREQQQLEAELAKAIGTAEEDPLRDRDRRLPRDRVGRAGIDADRITRIANIPPAECALHAPFASFGGQEFYPDVVQRAGVLCSRLVRNHPLPDGNKRTAYLSMLMFLEMNDVTWYPPSENERVLAVEALTARTMSEVDFIDWLREHTA